MSEAGRTIVTKKRGRVENLRPAKTTEVAKARGKLGGIKSGDAKREKKLMSQIYGEFLADRFKVDGKEATGADIISKVVKTVLNKGGAPAVSLMKEIREATEGSKTKMVGENGGPVEISIIKRVIIDPRT